MKKFEDCVYSKPWRRRLTLCLLDGNDMRNLFIFLLSTTIIPLVVDNESRTVFCRTVNREHNKMYSIRKERDDLRVCVDNTISNYLTIDFQKS